DISSLNRSWISNDGIMKHVSRGRAERISFQITRRCCGRCRVTCAKHLFINSAFDTNAATTLVIPSEVERSLALRLPRPLALLDEFPKLRFFAQLRVF